ncbi:MAG: cytochrome C [Rickettsiales bacterium]|nr:cytochrome C [Rickettsiales bacterium]
MNRLLFVTISFFVFTFTNNAFCGDVKAGEERYAQNCGNCHGPGGMGLASYPKIKGKEIPYLVDRLNTYRSGTRIGPNSDLMIMMAQPLSDVEIANLAAYLNAQK